MPGNTAKYTTNNPARGPVRTVATLDNTLFIPALLFWPVDTYRSVNGLDIGHLGIVMIALRMFRFMSGIDG
jgi:hypothetical protein